MYHKLLNSILLGLLATQFPSVDSRNIPGGIRCLELDFPSGCLNITNLSGVPGVRVSRSSEFIASDLNRRAGGKPRPKSKGDSIGESDGSGGGTTGGQREGTGGSDKTQGRTGGSSDNQGGGKRFGGEVAVKTTPGERLPEGEGTPSKRNNDNKPAQSTDTMDTKGVEYKLEDLRADFKAKATEKNILSSNQWFFYSGTYPINAVLYLRPLYSMKLKNPGRKLEAPTQEDMDLAKAFLPAMNDIRQDPLSQLGQPPKKIKTDKDLEDMDYYWAANSKAYAQFVKGDAILAIRLERNINQPSVEGRGTFWWTWEIAELTRNPNIENIKIIPIDSSYNEADGVPDPAAIGDPITIWSKGDDPLSYPADLVYEMSRPKESLSYDEVFQGNKVAKEPPGWEESKKTLKNQE